MDPLTELLPGAELERLRMLVRGWVASAHQCVHAQQQDVWRHVCVVDATGTLDATTPTSRTSGATVPAAQLVFQLLVLLTHGTCVDWTAHGVVCHTSSATVMQWKVGPRLSNVTCLAGLPRVVCVSAADALERVPSTAAVSRPGSTAAQCSAHTTAKTYILDHTTTATIVKTLRKHQDTARMRVLTHALAPGREHAQRGILVVRVPALVSRTAARVHAQLCRLSGVAGLAACTALLKTCYTGVVAPPVPPDSTDNVRDTTGSGDPGAPQSARSPPKSLVQSRIAFAVPEREPVRDGRCGDGKRVHFA